MLSNRLYVEQKSAVGRTMTGHTKKKENAYGTDYSSRRKEDELGQ